MKNIWSKLKGFIVKNWFLIINYIVIIIAYSDVYDSADFLGTEVMLGLWLFASAAYGGWKWFKRSGVH